MIIVIDTNVAIAALRSPMGASAEILRRVLRGKIAAAASVPLFIEYEAVMLRPAQLKAAKISARAVNNLLDVLAGVVIPVELFYLWRPQLKDADDDMVLEAAVNGQAGIIITFNVDDFLPAANRFSIRVLTPANYLKELRDGHYK